MASGVMLADLLALPAGVRDADAEDVALAVPLAEGSTLSEAVEDEVLVALEDAELLPVAVVEAVIEADAVTDALAPLDSDAVGVPLLLPVEDGGREPDAVADTLAVRVREALGGRLPLTLRVDVALPVSVGVRE